MSSDCIYSVRSLRFGRGRPKICVPLVGQDEPSLRREARALSSLPLDLVEWRADCFGRCGEVPALLHALQMLRGLLGATPLLFTFRSAAEGGSASLSFAEYASLNRAAAGSGLVDLVDLELFSAPEETLKALLAEIHAAGCGVVVSSHDFEKTPPAAEMTRRLVLAKHLGADLPKLAVMPRSEEDVLALLEATVAARRAGAGPLITMSMGALGGVSRLCGEVFGSALTFGCAQKASAPGQFPVRELDGMLTLLHNSL